MFPKNGRNKPSPNRNDLVGQRIGRLIVLETDYTNPKKAISKCQCDCGQIAFINRQSLVMAKTKSCGCLNLELCIDRIKKEAPSRQEDTLTKIFFRRYQHNAKERNHPFNLSLDQFKMFIKEDCFYCGAPPSIVVRNDRDERVEYFNGVDRIDNSLGYSEENCVPCCTNCNYRKHTLSFEDFIGWIKRTYENLKIKEIIKEEKWDE